MASASISVSVTVEASCVAAVAIVPTRTDDVPRVSVACSNPAPYSVIVNAAPGVGGRPAGNAANLGALTAQSNASGVSAGDVMVIVTY